MADEVTSRRGEAATTRHDEGAILHLNPVLSINSHVASAPALAYRRRLTAESTSDCRSRAFGVDRPENANRIRWHIVRTSFPFQFDPLKSIGLHRHADNARKKKTEMGSSTFSNFVEPLENHIWSLRFRIVAIEFDQLRCLKPRLLSSRSKRSNENPRVKQQSASNWFCGKESYISGFLLNRKMRRAHCTWNNWEVMEHMWR